MMKHRHAFRRGISVAALFLPATMAHAETLHTAPGKAVQVGYYSFLKGDCSGGAKPTFKLSSPIAHGQLDVKMATLSTKRLTQCGTVKAPTLVVIYKAGPTYTGSVPLSFDITNSENGQIQHVDATVDVAP